MSKGIHKLVIAFCGIILGWILVVPAFEFPDEQAHFATISTLIDRREMPSYAKQDLSLEMAETQKYLGIFRDGLGNNRFTYHPEYHVEYTDNVVGIHEQAIINLNTWENRSSYVGSEAAKYPPLYYSFTALFTRMVNDQDIFTRLFISRLAGLFIIAAITVVTWKIGYLIFNSRIYANTLAFMVLLQPMFSFVSAGVNSDNLHNLWFTILIYLSLKIIQNGLALTDLLKIGATIALDIYTKPQGFIGIPIIAVAILLSIFRHKQWRMLGWVTLVGIIAFILSSSQWEAYNGLFAVSNNRGVSFVEYLQFSANKLVAQNAVWYWGVFKWLGVVLPPIYWRVANRVVLLSAVGIVIYLWKVIKKRKTIAEPYAVGYMLLASILYALIIFWYDWQHTKQNGYSLGIQARYFFPTISAHMTIMLTGITSLGWNGIARKWLRRALVLLFVWLQLGALWHIIKIYYPGHSLSEIIIQVSQYKPWFAKGNWWYLWGSIYLISLIHLVKNSLSQGKYRAWRLHQK